MNKLQKKYETQIHQMVSVCHKLADDKYVTSHGGNISMTVDRPVSTESNILITPTKKFKGDIIFDDICITDYNGRILYAQTGEKPTGELPFHLLLYHERPDIASIVHAHPPYTTALAISKKGKYLSYPILPETVVEIGPVCTVPYVEPLTKKLADSFEKYLDRYDAFLMENHGITVISRENVERTRQFVDIIECTAISIIGALSAGDIKLLSRKDVKDLERTIKTRNLHLPGKPGMWKKLTDCYNFI